MDSDYPFGVFKHFFPITLITKLFRMLVNNHNILSGNILKKEDSVLDKTIKYIELARRLLYTEDMRAE